VVSLKVVHPLKVNQHTKFHYPTLTSASYASISEVWTVAFFLEWLKLWDYKLWHRGHLQWHDLPNEFHKIYQFL